MKKEYIVGIDFGHGETSAWFVPLDLETDEKNGKSLALKSSNKNFEYSFYSVMYFNPNTGYSLGNNLDSNIITGFKDKVSVLNQPQNREKKEAYIEYIKAIYNRLLDYNTKLKGKNEGGPNFYLCIACPTKWNQDEKDDYIQFFNSALNEFGVEVMWVINESDAAYFSHGSIHEYKDKCVLIIDYGSSTIDYTVVYQGKKISDDNWSNRLGASNVECSILEKCRDDGEFQEKFENTRFKLEGIGSSFIDVYSIIQFEIRKEKEYSVTYGLYPDLEMSFNLIGRYTDYGVSDEFKTEKRKYRFEIECQIDKVIKEYQDRVVEDFEELKKKIQSKIGNKKIDHVILSGGACRMPWVRDAVEKIFNPLEIDLDNQASFVVAKGIALYAKAQMIALEKFLQKIKELDYINMYIKADSNATATAIKTMMPAMIRKLKSKSSITGITVRQDFCDFVENLNDKNQQYCNLVQQELDSLISNSVGEGVKEAIQSVFKVNVDTSDVKLHVSANVLPWRHDLFEPGGEFYDAFTNWIDNSSDRLIFTWNRIRVEPELSKIISGTADTLENIVDTGQIADYPQDALKIYAEEIKKQVLKNAEDLFYKKQLFNTTFKK